MKTKKTQKNLEFQRSACISTVVISFLFLVVAFMQYPQAVAVPAGNVLKTEIVSDDREKMPAVEEPSDANSSADSANTSADTSSEVSTGSSDDSDFRSSTGSSQSYSGSDNTIEVHEQPQSANSSSSQQIGARVGKAPSSGIPENIIIFAALFFGLIGVVGFIIMRRTGGMY